MILSFVHFSMLVIDSIVVIWAIGHRAGEHFIKIRIKSLCAHIEFIHTIRLAFRAISEMATL